jgi:hypothetical protein
MCEMRRNERANSEKCAMSMKSTILAVSIAINLLLGGYLLWPTQKHVEGFKVQQAGRFSIMMNETNTNSYVVALDKGRYYWTIDDDNQSINFGLWTSFTVFCKPGTDRVTHTLMQYRDNDGKVVYLVDANGDGIIDQRRKVGESAEYFIGGNFYKSANEGERKFIIKDGKRVEVAFDGSRWQIRE